ncbi:MAG TPA: M56 family metallopeptidase [Vicinamibacterales bacterium]|nr:M56 family metallopeptidase [Vicinamibacterales bacterium]
MTTALFAHPAAQALAWSLVHFLWQGAVVGVLTFGALRYIRLSPSSRYALGVAAMVAMLAAPVATFVTLMDRAPGVLAATEPAADVLALVPADAAAGRTPPETLTSAAGVPQPVFEAVVLLGWIVGVAVLGVRLFGGWIVARRLTSVAVQPISGELDALVRRVAGRLALTRVVHVVESSRVAVPVLVGWLKPVVLLPASSLSGLTPTQIEALVAHELAHVQRHDYLVNLLQAAVETLLFYHPAVWWVSRQVRTEREHCCDDLAVGVCDRLEYVSALASLAAMTAVPATALAATDGSLVGRVRRLLSPERLDEPTGSVSWVAAAGIALAIVAAAAAVPLATGSGDVPEVPEPVLLTSDTPQAPTAVPPAGGVPAGQPAGVPGGVPAGVVGGVPGEPAPQTPPARERQADARAEELRKAVNLAEHQWRDAQRQIELQKLELELKQAQLENQFALKTAEAELEALQRELKEARARLEVGLARPEEVRTLELQLQRAEQQYVTARGALEMRQREFELRRQEFDLRAEYERRLSELEMAGGETRALLEAELRSGVDLAREQAVLAERELRRRIDEAVRDHPLQAELAAREADLARWVDVLEAGATLRQGDVVRIVIEDEPFLPRDYRIGDDGAIRVPFLGAIAAEGRTADEVRTQIVRELAARNLKRDAAVTVTARRPRR